MTAQQLRRSPGSSGLYDVLELILDRGLVIDAYARVSLVGIEILTVDLRVVVASVDTYIRYAEAMERLGWHERERKPAPGLPDMVDGASGALQKTAGRGVASVLASRAHTAAEHTGSSLVHKAGKLVESLTGADKHERAPHGEGADAEVLDPAAPEGHIHPEPPHHDGHEEHS